MLPSYRRFSPFISTKEQLFLGVLPHLRRSPLDPGIFRSAQSLLLTRYAEHPLPSHSYVLCTTNSPFHTAGPPPSSASARRASSSTPAASRPSLVGTSRPRSSQNARRESATQSSSTAAEAPAHMITPPSGPRMVPTRLAVELRCRMTRLTR